MKKHGPYLLLAMALVLAPLGCEEDATGPEGLNEAEVEALFNGINETVGALLQDTTLTPVFLSLDSVVFEPECPQGGRVRVAVFPPEVDTLVTLAIDISTNLVPTGCVVSGDGYTFTLTGNPSLRYQLKVAFVSLVQVRMQGASEGTLDWELEDRDGTSRAGRLRLGARRHRG